MDTIKLIQTVMLIITTNLFSIEGCLNIVRKQVVKCHLRACKLYRQVSTAAMLNENTYFKLKISYKKDRRPFVILYLDFFFCERAFFFKKKTSTVTEEKIIDCLFKLIQLWVQTISLGLSHS